MDIFVFEDTVPHGLLDMRGMQAFDDAIFPLMLTTETILYTV